MTLITPKLILGNKVRLGKTFFIWENVLVRHKENLEITVLKPGRYILIPEGEKDGKSSQDLFLERITLGEKMMLLRRRAGWTQAEFALMLGVNQKRIDRFERDEAVPSNEEMVRILSLLQPFLGYKS